MSVTERIIWDPFEEPEGGMEFRLTYEGLLLSGVKETDSRKAHKHEIRRQFHPQLRQYWGIHPGLKVLAESTWDGGLPSNAEPATIEALARRFTRSSGHRFVPLVREELSLMCKLEILLLRRPEANSHVYSKGDLDNRVKTIVDALKIPSDGNELPGSGPGKDEDPFFVLLEEDKLLTHLSVETDYLLGGIAKMKNGVMQPDDVNDAKVVIKVTLKPYSQTFGAGLGNMLFV